MFVSQSDPAKIFLFLFRVFDVLKLVAIIIFYHSCCKDNVRLESFKMRICVFMFYTMLGDKCWQDWQGAGGRAGGENHWVEAAGSLVKRGPSTQF